MILTPSIPLPEMTLPVNVLPLEPVRIVIPSWAFRDPWPVTDDLFLAAYGGPVPLTYGNIAHLANNEPRPGSDLLEELMNGVVTSRVNAPSPGAA